MNSEQVLHSLLKASQEPAGSTFLQALVQEIAQLFGAERVLIAESQEVSTASVLVDAAVDLPTSGEVLSPGQTLNLAGLPCAEVYNGVQVTVNSGLSQRYPRATPFQSYTGVPLLDAAGAIQGHLGLYSTTADVVWDTSVLQLFARIIQPEVQRMVLEREQEKLSKEVQTLSERLLQESILEPLTGLMNRRHFSQLLLGEFLRFKRYGEAFGVLIVGVDEFKRINDRFGHDAGEMVLKEVAGIIQQEVRHGVDISAHLSGEEFVVLCVHAQLDHAAVLAERLRRKLGQLTYSREEGTLKVTCCLGLSVVSKEDTTWEQVLKRANVGLYEAKSRGRNQVVAWV